MIALLVLAQAAALTPDRVPQRVVPMVPRPKTGTLRCDLSEQGGRTFRIRALLSEARVRENQPARPQMSVRGAGDTALDGDYLGWLTTSNSSFSFSNVNRAENTLVTLTFFGVAWSSRRVAAVAQIDPIGEGDQTFVIGHCEPQWER